MNHKIARIVIGLMLVWIQTAVSHAQEDAGQAGTFLRYGVGGRALGMGRAFTSVADDASGIYWNPAGIVGAKRVELTSMYTNLYYDSQFSYVGVVFPRPARNLKDKVANFLIGPSAAFGFGWVNLASTGYEQRTRTGVHLGDFGFQENAFLAAWAREDVNSWGIFRYGLNFKFVSQNISGLQSTSWADYSSLSEKWSGGMDLGMTFQPFHAPLFNLISLRYVLPLRLGLVVQNAIRPGWKGLDDKKVPFPIIVRFGLSYRFILKDWIPSSWEGFKKMVGYSHILFSMDKEFYQGPQTGSYYGFEGYFPLSKNGFVFYPRAGFNNQTEKTALGAGLSLPFSTSAILRIDYAHCMHPHLPEDNRFFLTFQMGKFLGAEFFKERANRPDIKDEEIRDDLMRVLAEYPNEHIFGVVDRLVELEDSSMARRYYDLTGGLGRASWLLKEAKQFLKEGKIKRAQRKAIESTKEYAPIFVQKEHTLTDKDLMDYGESLIIANSPEEACAVLMEVEVLTLRAYYLLGICRKNQKDWDGAIEMFRGALNQYGEEQDTHSMVSLSFLGLGEALIRKEQYQSALTTLEILLKNYTQRLDPNYPRYPSFVDNYISDDAQFLIGVCSILMDLKRDGVAALVQTQRFYPDLEYGLYIDQYIESYLDAVKTANWERLDENARSLLDYYFEAHKLPFGNK